MAKPTKAKSLQFGLVALCEFATKGERNKHTLVNIFSGDILVGGFPAGLHFGFYAEIRPDESFPGSMQIAITYNDEKRATVTINFENFSPERPAIVLIPAFNIIADAAGVLEFTAITRGYSDASLLKKNIGLSEELKAELAARQPTRGKRRLVKSSSSDLPPPSSRSRSASSRKGS